MKKLLDVDPATPKTFDPKTDLVGLFSDLPIGRTHNVVVDWDNEYILAVGAQPRNQTCKAGLQYIDFSNPSKPSSPGCSSQDGYVHDAQCVTYNGPDRRYRGRNICIGYNEDTMTVYDSTSKDGNPASEILSTLSYPGATYCHQGWWTESNWHQYVLLNDELDEVEKVGPGASGRPVTHIVDLTDLRNPKATGTFFATDQKAIDHNLYIVDGLAYQSNYGAGIWVHDVSSISKDSTGKDVTVEGFFDIYPEDDAQGGVVEFVGTWSHFLFPSGYILVSKFMQSNPVRLGANFLFQTRLSAVHSPSSLQADVELSLGLATAESRQEEAGRVFNQCHGMKSIGSPCERDGERTKKLMIMLPLHKPCFAQ